jgi:sulfur-carrier protein
MVARTLHRRLQSAVYRRGARITVVARNLRGVIKAMDQLYPGLGHHLEEETAVTIDGALHETAYFQPIRPGCEIFSSPSSNGASPPFLSGCPEDHSLLRREAAKLAALSFLNSSRVPSGSATKRA